MTEYLQDVMAENFVPAYAAVHDCVDTGNDLTIIGGDPPIPFPCDSALRDKYNVKKYFDSVTGNVKDGFLWAKLLVEIAVKVNAPTGTSFIIGIVIPHPTFGDIPVRQREFIIPKNNVDYSLDWVKPLENADDGEAHLYGYNITLWADTTCTLKARSIKVTQ
jgi:hypothetical protein